jgi:hypothetical protein
MSPLFVFLTLQLLDFGTTIVALEMGGVEQNPFIAQFMALGPLPGLILSKLLVIVLAALFVVIGKTKTVRLANIAFALVVIWNLTIIGRLTWLA